MVNQFIQNNIVSAKVGRRCVDGRYDGEGEGMGMIARPGGDAGYALILLATSRSLDLGFSPEDCFDKVYSAITKNGEDFFIHTDEHSEEEHGVIGCGHLAKAANPELSEDYGVNTEDAEKLISYIKECAKTRANIKNVVLEGDHKEEAVLVVTSIDKTVRSQNEEEMYFVYDKDRDETFMRNLVKELDNYQITFELFQEISDKQLMATLHNLALGKPIFEVSLDGETPILTPQGTIY